MNRPNPSWPVSDPHKSTILVVEDNSVVRTTLSEMVEQLGFDVLQANNASEALYLLTHHPQVELLISDVVLRGGMNGVDLMLQVERYNLGLPSMLISGFDLQEVQMLTHTPQAIPLLRKPFSLRQLRAEILKFLGSISG